MNKIEIDDKIDELKREGCQNGEYKILDRLKNDNNALDLIKEQRTEL